MSNSVLFMALKTARRKLDEAEDHLLDGDPASAISALSDAVAAADTAEMILGGNGGSRLTQSEMHANLYRVMSVAELRRLVSAEWQARGYRGLRACCVQAIYDRFLPAFSAECSKCEHQASICIEGGACRLRDLSKTNQG